MKKLRVGVVGLGHRGRLIADIVGLFDDIAELSAACDIIPANWYEKQWLSDRAFSEKFPDAVFYESYDEMLNSANLDAVVVYRK